MASVPQTFRRVDVFSPSSGVGKTLIAVRLAQLQARARGAPVLLVDADIGGPCLGDLLESWASPPWDSTPNLLHLICGRPEYLPEQLSPGKLPVYRVRDARPEDPRRRAPELFTAALREAAVLLCPSHPHSTNPRIEPAVLHALLGHESAGGWIGYLIQQVIAATYRILRGNLGGVIVDHAPTMGALQAATLREAAEQPGGPGEGGERRALFVTTRRAADLAATRDLAGRLAAVAPRLKELKGPADDPAERALWVVNRVPAEAGDWKEWIRARYPRNDGWLDGARAVRVDEAMAVSQAEADLHRDRGSPLDEDLQAIRATLFE